MRLIDADRLLEERRLHLYYHLPNGDTAIPIIDIKHAPTVNNGGWIPVSERMPEEDEEVLVFDGAGCSVMALVNRDKTDVWHWDGSYYMEWQNFNGTIHADISDVTHWMPLPAPPKEGNGDG